MAKKVSLKDIAKEVGVSTALVSYVLNNLKEGRISKEIALKIREVAQRLNYRPNQIAKSLKTSKTFTIGLIVADIANPFSSTPQSERASRPPAKLFDSIHPAPAFGHRASAAIQQSFSLSDRGFFGRGAPISLLPDGGIRLARV